MAEGGQILEGFLCPICKADLGSEIQLQNHFQENHIEDQDVLKSLKGLLDRAKKKILKLDDDDFLYSHLANSPKPSSKNISYIPSEPQQLGKTKSHFEYYKSIRNNWLERYAAETNKLLIRLDKLLIDIPSDPVKKKWIGNKWSALSLHLKLNLSNPNLNTVLSLDDQCLPAAHEQSIVPWIDDKHVKLCPNCARSFHLARRKHHCRLCGAIMCHDCTQFLSFSEARKMTCPIFSDSAEIESSDSSTVHSSSSSPGPGGSKLPRSSSTTSLNSMLSLVDMGSEQHNQFRLCIPCKQLLEMRERQKDLRASNPIISQLYDHLRNLRTETEPLAEMYYKMSTSFNNGEPTYHLTDAQVLRVKIIKLAENIDLISKKIACLGLKDEILPSPKTLKLQQMIRYSTTTYLKEDLLILPQLPSEEELKSRQEKRMKEVSARIHQSKVLAQQRAALRDNSSRRVGSASSGSEGASPGKGAQISIDKGWGPATTPSNLGEHDDPMIQQMNIIRNFIKQARSAHKYDEVSILESNLKELQEEYWAQQNQQHV